MEIKGKPDVVEPLAECRSEEHEADHGQPVDSVACDRAAAIFRALGDPNRLRILVMLREGERCVTAIASELGDNMPAISQRLKLLRSERVITSRREGKHVFYALADRCVSELVTHALRHAAEATARPEPVT